MIKPSLMKFLRRGDASAAARQPLIIRHYGARRGTRLQRVDRAALADQPQAQAVRLHVRYTIDAHNYDEVVPPYQIPYRALVVAGLAIGFVAGRCFSADGRRWLRRASWPRAAWPARRQRTPPPSVRATGTPSATWVVTCGAVRERVSRRTRGVGSGGVYRRSKNAYTASMSDRTHRTTVSEKGQITIPKALRESLGIRPGTVLEVTAVRGELIAQKREAEESVAQVARPRSVTAWRDGRRLLGAHSHVSDYRSGYLGGARRHHG